jgi:hypothetical protein
MRDVIFVVGMGRSGSSALTRVLSLCGAALPFRMLPADVANPRGYWEPRDAVDLNNRFLARYGSSWYDEAVELDVAGEPHGFIDEIAHLFAEGFERHGPIVVKEPRISALLPHWRAGAAKAGLRATAVHVFRRPDEVAASLARRDGLSVRQSYALWLKYNLLAERDARGLPRAFVTYADLMADWRRVVELCAQRLGVALDAGAPASTAVAGFLLPQLRHHASDGSPIDAAGEDLVLPTYALLNAAKSGDAGGDAFDAIFAAFTRSRTARPKLGREGTG